MFTKSKGLNLPEGTVRKSWIKGKDIAIYMNGGWFHRNTNNIYPNRKAKIMVDGGEMIKENKKFDLEDALNSINTASLANLRSKPKQERPWEVAEALAPALSLIPGVGPIGGAIAKTAIPFMKNMFVNKPSNVTSLPQINPYTGKPKQMQMGGNFTQWNAPSHQMGGMAVDRAGLPTTSENAVAEIEKGENMIKETGGNYVFSDTLTDPKTGLTMAQKAKMIQKKYKSRKDDLSKNAYRKQMEDLKALNEKLKQRAALEANSQPKPMVQNPQTPQDQQQQGMPQMPKMANMPQMSSEMMQQGMPKMQMGGKINDPILSFQQKLNSIPTPSLVVPNSKTDFNSKFQTSLLKSGNYANRVGITNVPQDLSPKKPMFEPFKVNPNVPRVSPVSPLKTKAEISNPLNQPMPDLVTTNSLQPMINRLPDNVRRKLYTLKGKEYDDYLQQNLSNLQARDEKFANKAQRQDLRDANKLQKLRAAEGEYENYLKKQEERKANRAIRKEENALNREENAGYNAGLALKLGALGATAIDALLPAEVEKLRMPDFSAGDQSYSNLGISPQTQLNEVARATAAARKSTEAGARSFGQMSQRLNQLYATSGAKASEVSQKAKQYNDQMAMAVGNREDSKSLKRQQELIRKQTADSQNKAARRTAIRNVLSDATELGTSLQQLQYMKNYTKGLAQEERERLKQVIDYTGGNLANYNPEGMEMYISTGDVKYLMKMGIDPKNLPSTKTLPGSKKETNKKKTDK